MGSAYDADVPLLRKLGLHTSWGYAGWNDLGTVTIREAEPERGVPAATVQVEVTSMPAQFFRFTVLRPHEGGPGPVEKRVVTTGSGSFREFWPALPFIADGCFEVEVVDDVLAELVEVGRAALTGYSYDVTQEALSRLVDHLTATPAD